MSDSILPGATLGVLGSGQLGRMFAVAARRLGYRVHVYSPDNDSPTGQLADLEVSRDYNDEDALAEFARKVDAVTFEFENVPIQCINIVERFAPVRPAGNVLHTTQQRLREKTFLSSAGIPVTPFVAIESPEQVESIRDDMFPGVLKTAAWGYDGKGQTKVEAKADLPQAWAEIGGNLAVLEKFVEFDSELSVVAVRSHDGDFAGYGPISNTHENHILDLSVTPAGLPPSVSQSAHDIARTILEQLDVVGVLCVEFFLTGSGDLLVNELAPRPHNSGHLTVDAHVACQFEQQVRAVCGLPLGSTDQLRPAAMVNLLGDCWSDGPPNWANALAVPNLKLHLYGKHEPRPGRKMGHMTVLADSPEEAARQALSTRQALLNRSGESR